MYSVCVSFTIDFFDNFFFLILNQENAFWKSKLKRKFNFFLLKMENLNENYYSKELSYAQSTYFTSIQT